MMAPMPNASTHSLVATPWIWVLLVGCGGTAAGPNREARSATDARASETPTPDGSMPGASATATPDASAPATPAVGAAGSMREGTYFVLADAPDPLACTADEQCAAVSVLAPDGCCIADPPIPRPAAQSWSAWMKARRASDACRGVECPPVGQPSPPDDCYFSLHCVEGRCANTCPAEWMVPITAPAAAVPG
jgi:hypothetical protein